MPLTTIFPLSKHIFHPNLSWLHNTNYTITLQYYITVQFSRLVEAKIAAHDGGQIQFQSPTRSVAFFLFFFGNIFSLRK